MAHMPRKQPRQARASATQALIVEAAARILEDPTAPSFTTNAIAEKAGVSIGSLYQYFPDKDAIIASLLRREWQNMLEAMTISLSEDSCPEDGIGAFIDIAIAHQFARPRMSRQLEFLEQSLDLDEDLEALSAEIQARVLAQLRRYWPEVSPAPARDVISICRAIINDNARLSLHPEPDLKSRLNAAIFGYLNATRADSPSR